MEEKRDELKDIFKKAIDMEERGNKFYKEQSAKCGNPLGKRTFTALSEDEIDHIKAIKAFYGSLLDAEKAAPLEDILSEIPKQRAIDKLFSQPIKELSEKIDVSTDDKEAYKFAMDFENEGFNFYKRHRQSTESAEVQNLLEFLMKEERAHYNILQSTYLYLYEPAEWFNQQEYTMFEGG